MASSRGRALDLAWPERGFAVARQIQEATGSCRAGQTVSWLLSLQRCWPGRAIPLFLDPEGFTGLSACGCREYSSCGYFDEARFLPSQLCMLESHLPSRIDRLSEGQAGEPHTESSSGQAKEEARPPWQPGFRCILAGACGRHIGRRPALVSRSLWGRACQAHAGVQSARTSRFGSGVARASSSLQSSDGDWTQATEGSQDGQLQTGPPPAPILPPSAVALSLCCCSSPACKSGRQQVLSGRQTASIPQYWSDYCRTAASL